MMGIGFTSCDNALDEHPRAIITPDYFNTKSGIEKGINALYANLRNTWGQGYYFNSLETGTDEYTYGQSADENFKCMDMTADVSPLTPSNCRADVLWNNAFIDINTANVVIEKGKELGMDESLIVEANFFRALDYFELVQTFGGVPLDLGAGELKFNDSPNRESKRNTVPEVYKAIFDDLVYAVETLPDKSRMTGTVTKTTARLFLAKAYLTYAWWLENPNNIPTYPECTRDASKAKDYFQKAYDTAVEAINNPAGYGLQPAFFDTFYGPNDRNSEILLYADHTAQNEYYNGGVGYGYGSGAAPDNFSHWMNRWNYTNARAVTADGKQTDPLKREAAASYDRPWTRMATPCEVPAMFTDKNIDSRFETTFVTTFFGNWNKGGDATASYTCANGMPVKNGEVVLTFYGENDPEVVYKANQSGIAAGEKPGVASWIITPDHLTRIAYLNVWKNGYYNETDDGTGLGQPNGANPRPANIARFAEFYFIAAEAAVKGATVQGDMTAYNLINVIRARAGKWRIAANADKDQRDIQAGPKYLDVYEDHSAEMVAATPKDITIDYILDERFREFYGEGLRWWDLVRTQKWEEKASTYTIGGNDYGSAVEKHTREIKKSYYLRPIPQGQIDALQMNADKKAAYQNPGY